MEVQLWFAEFKNDIYFCPAENPGMLLFADESRQRSLIAGEYQSGQMGQTVNLLAYAFGGSNPSSPTKKKVLLIRYFCRKNNTICGSSSVDRALAFQAKGREFEPRLPLQGLDMRDKVRTKAPKTLF